MQQLKSLLIKAKAEQLALETDNSSVSKPDPAAACLAPTFQIFIPLKLFGAWTPQMKEELLQLRQDMQQLHVRSGKLEYRVQHLKDAVADGDAALIEALKAGIEQRPQLLEKYEALLKTRLDQHE